MSATDERLDSNPIRVRMQNVLKRMPYGGLMANPPRWDNQHYPQWNHEGDLLYFTAVAAWLEALADRLEEATDEHEDNRRKLYDLQQERSMVRRFFGVET